MIIDHMNLPVSDLAVSRLFYDAVLAPLGCVVVAEDGPAVGYGTTSWSFGIELTGDAIVKLHVAFAAASRLQVDAFFAAAVGAGAMSNGDPGNRPQYGPDYYAAFVKDPDGHNIEAVYRG